jgi:hypothetical protein
MGPIAVVLLRTDLPALLKYPILAITTWVASNLIAYAGAKLKELKTPWFPKPGAFIIGPG